MCVRGYPYILSLTAFSLVTHPISIPRRNGNGGLVISYAFLTHFQLHLRSSPPLLPIPVDGWMAQELAQHFWCCGQSDRGGERDVEWRQTNTRATLRKSNSFRRWDVIRNEKATITIIDKWINEMYKKLCITLWIELVVCFTYDMNDIRKQL